MKALVAIVLGFMSGFLIYMSAAMLFTTPSAGNSPSPAFVMIAFLGGWAASAYYMHRGAQTVARVVTRGALIGAAEWLLIGLASVVMSGKVVADTTAAAGQSNAAAAGAVLGGGILAAIGGGISVVMAVVCLIVFAVAHFAGRELRDTSGTPSKKCPECAEMVQAEARKCKHCGAVLVDPAVPASGVGAS